MAKAEAGPGSACRMLPPATAVPIQGQKWSKSYCSVWVSESHETERPATGL